MKARPHAVPLAVGAYITAAYWFTASTSFANPAVTLARAFSNTFAGIRPVDAPAFVAAQFAGALSATALFRWFLPNELRREAPKVLVPHPKETSGAATKTYIFACVHNAGRSQMAAAFFNLYAEEGCRAVSAGTVPTERIHSEVTQVMSEIGTCSNCLRSGQLGIASPSAAAPGSYRPSDCASRAGTEHFLHVPRCYSSWRRAVGIPVLGVHHLN